MAEPLRTALQDGPAPPQPQARHRFWTGKAFSPEGLGTEAWGEATAQGPPATPAHSVR